MFVQPFKIFIYLGRVYDQKKFFRLNPVDDQIIDHATAIVQEKCVLALGYRQFVDVVG